MITDPAAIKDLVDAKGQLLVRRSNLQRELVDWKKKVLTIEADLITARRAADITDGAIQSTDAAISLIGSMLPIPGEPTAVPSAT